MLLKLNTKTLTHVLYLHGFRSSPQSTKASRLASLFSSTYPDVHWWCPQLPPSPLEASKLISEGTANWPKESIAVIGSSLGGFYATWLAHRYDCKAVLINPAIEPARDLAKYIGEHSVWHDLTNAFTLRLPMLKSYAISMWVNSNTRKKYLL